MQDKWTDQLRSSLSDYEVTPPEGLWESLAEALPASHVPAETPAVTTHPTSPTPTAPPPIAMTKRAPYRRWSRLAAVAALIALLLAIGTGVWMATNDDSIALPSDTAALLPEHTPTPSHPASNEATPLSSAHVSTSVFQSIAKSIIHTSPTPSTHIAQSTSDAEAVPPASTAYGSPQVSSAPQSQEGAGSSQDTVGERRLSLRHTEDPHSHPHDSYTGHKAHIRRGVTSPASRFSIGLLTAYAGTYDTTASSCFMPSPNDPDIDFGSNGPLIPTEEITDTHHSLPVRVGLTVQYPLTDRFSLESGLMYTYLSSEKSVLIPDIRLTLTRYRMHYLGLPLTVKYRLNRTSYHGFDAYVSAGGAIEKCVSGSERTAVITSTDRTTSLSSCHAHPWQWSLTAGAGVQFRPIPYFAIYLEPGLTYYPHASTSLPTIYRDRPLQFNLTLGLRFLLPR